MLAVWVVSGLTALPVLITTELYLPKTTEHQKCQRYVCTEASPLGMR